MTSSVSTSDRQAIEALSARYAEPAWLLQRRLEAWRLYEDMPLPDANDDEWRRTDLKALSLEGIPLFSPPSLPVPRAPDDNGYAGEINQQDGIVTGRALASEAARQGMVFTDLHAAAGERPELFRAHFMTEAVPPTDWKLVALHAALWQGGVFLHVPAGVEVSLPLRASIGLNGSGAVFPHTLVIAEAGSSVTLIEEQSSPGDGGPALSSSVVEILARQGAHVRYLGVQDWGRNVNSFSTVRAILAAESSLEMGLVGVGSAVAVGRTEAILAGPGARADVVGLFLARDAQHFNQVTLQDHQAPNTSSDLLFKSAVRDSAQFVWRGLTRIRRGAGESDANQSSRSLLLGEQAWVAPSPLLEIEAHDVARCSHGATVSSVDDEQLYYMMSRGLPREEASRQIVDGFFRQGLERLTAVADHKQTGRMLERRLLTGAV